jgi:leucyl-tRNA---protein transferase
MSEQHKNFPEFYVTAPQQCPYLPERTERKLFTHLTHEKPVALIDNLLKGGFRRSQNIAYMPYCDGCQACISTRVVIAEFEPSRSMRRVAASNVDVVARRVPNAPTAEQYALFRRYIDSRHAGGGMADMTIMDFAMMIEDSIVDTFLTEYRRRPATGANSTRPDKWPLVGVALCDRLSDGVSMVYSFYDPDCGERSLGTHIILDHIGYAEMLGLPFLYLGYWIEGSRKMSYKQRFQPQEYLTMDKGWSKA